MVFRQVSGLKLHIGAVLCLHCVVCKKHYSFDFICVFVAAAAVEFRLFTHVCVVCLGDVLFCCSGCRGISVASNCLLHKSCCPRLFVFIFGDLFDCLSNYMLPERVFLIYAHFLSELH